MACQYKNTYLAIFSVEINYKKAKKGTFYLLSDDACT